ncbi:MAG: MBL fold metallo-hydrolase [Geodermatophilaceae bacterium]|nr:MBL fold metallo-hydrolase [Geodermatophilaceae bacterium]MDQ3476624.1 MBL fold metallo-hydrolase [Actinomycetota bacterium]
MTSPERPYTGAVSTGGPADVRELSGLRISKLSVGPMDNNAYLLECTATGDGLLIDAANEPDRILELANGISLRRIVTTHRHPDHWQALSDVVQKTGAATSAHPLDGAELPVPVSDPVEHGDTLSVGQVELGVVQLRGHTPGSIALLWEGDGHHLFTGDSLFPGGPGNTFGNTEDFVSLMNDLEERIFAALPDETWVYPGHGSDTTLGTERPHLAEWRARGW